jgi:twitching motility protein PilT
VEPSPAATSLPAPPDAEDLFGELDAGLAAGASDWLYKGGEPCSVRAFGNILTFAERPLPETRLQAMLMAALGSATRIPIDRDAAFAHRGEFFRVHTYSAGGVFCCNLRHIPGRIRPLDSLGLPPAFRDVALQSPRGLILVTGPTRSGKSTTLAAAIEHRNDRLQEVIFTFEDPIEFRHPNRRSVVRQLQKGLDFESFGAALRGALRSDPDVILVGEMRDAETISAALTAAEAGRLVLGSLHCGTARDAVSRIADAYPAERAAEVRTQLAKNLVAVLAQQLVRSRDQRLAGAFELLLGTTGVRHLIADPGGKHSLLANEIATGAGHGMISMDQSLHDLCRRRVIDRTEALRCAVQPAALAALLQAAR